MQANIVSQASALAQYRGWETSSQAKVWDTPEHTADLCQVKSIREL